MRTSGVLMPISSLPSPYGIGTMGKSARKFVDFLVKGGQTYWQILPICPTSYGDSPYQSFSSFAGNPYFIDLDILCKENLLKKKECESFDWGTSEEYIDYGTMYVSRYALLHKAYARFVKNMPEDFSSFCEAEKDWLEDYTLFMALKDANDGKAWGQWDEKLRVRDAAALDEARKKYAEDIEFYKMLQYLFFKQWRELKAYANENGIEIIGVQFRNVATVGGSIWGRFGFSDVMTIFRALGAKVQLHKAGIMDLDEFAALPRTTRDVLVSVIVPKNAKGVVYLSQRNQSTDFPVLTCAVANRNGRYVAVIGASPYMAEPVWDKDGILDGIVDAKTHGNVALTENSENNAKIDKFAEYVAEHIRFGSNIRAGAEYREMICRVLTRRAVTQSLDICDDIR